MTDPRAARQIEIQNFVTELMKFVTQAEDQLNSVSVKQEARVACLTDFASKMIAVRGTASLLDFPEIARVAGLGEELAARAAETTIVGLFRQARDTLWDVLSTVRFMMEHPEADTTEEHEILLTRVHAVLESLGGQRDRVSQDEIAELLKNHP